MSNENAERWWFDESTNTVRDENRLPVAHLPGDYEGSLDGHTLAAAPAMLEALKALADRVDSEAAYGDTWPEWSAAYAAIRIAEGR